MELKIEESEQLTRLKSSSKSIFSPPPSTDSTIIIGWNQSQRRYNRADFSPEQVGNTVTNEDVDRFLEEVDHEVRKILRNDSKGCFVFFLLFFSGGIILFLQKITKNDYIYLFYLAWAVLLAVYLIWAIVRRRRIFAQTRLYIKALIRKYHKTFREHGLRWVIPEDFPLWIELHKGAFDPSLSTMIYSPPKHFELSSVNEENKLEDSHFTSQQSKEETSLEETAL